MLALELIHPMKYTQLQLQLQQHHPFSLDGSKHISRGYISYFKVLHLLSEASQPYFGKDSSSVPFFTNLTYLKPISLLLTNSETYGTLRFNSPFIRALPIIPIVSHVNLISYTDSYFFKIYCKLSFYLRLGLPTDFFPVGLLVKIFKTLLH